MMLENLRLLADRSLIAHGVEGDPFLPPWLVPLMGRYGSGAITDGEFLAAISYMAERGVILPG